VQDREPAEIPITPDAALGNEWAVIVDAPGYAACLLAWERPRSPAERRQPDGERRFEALWTLEAPAVVDAARAGASILAGLGVTVGLILLIVPGLILLTLWALVAPVVVIERPGVIASLGRSRELVRGNGWTVFGVIVVLFLISFIVSAVVSAIAVAIAGDVAGQLIGNLLANVLIAPLSALAASVMYFQLRGGREGATLAGGPEAPLVAGGPEAPVPGARPAAPARPGEVPPAEPGPDLPPPGTR
jgi:hypothetical protein